MAAYTTEDFGPKGNGMQLSYRTGGDFMGDDFDEGVYFLRSSVLPAGPVGTRVFGSYFLDQNRGRIGVAIAHQSGLSFNGGSEISSAKHATVTSVPEPSNLLLMIVGLAGVGAVVKRRRSN